MKKILVFGAKGKPAEYIKQYASQHTSYYGFKKMEDGKYIQLVDMADLVDHPLLRKAEYKYADGFIFLWDKDFEEEYHKKWAKELLSYQSIPAKVVDLNKPDPKKSFIEAIKWIFQIITNQITKKNDPSSLFFKQTVQKTLPPAQISVNQARSKKKEFHRETDPVEFFHDRFEIHNPQHNHTVVSGSTHSHAQIEVKEEINIDASAGAPIKDTLGVTHGFSMATSGGEGDFFGPNASRLYSNKQAALAKGVSSVAQFCCDTFTQQVKEGIDLEETVRDIAKQSKQDGFTLINEEQEILECSLVGTAVFHQQNRIRVENINVGDALVVILDGKTHEIKHQLSAKKYERSQGSEEDAPTTFSPFLLQQLGESYEKLNVNSLEKQSVNCKEGDIVIHMTQGMYAALQTNSTVKKESVTYEKIEFQIEYEDLEMTKIKDQKEVKIKKTTTSVRRDTSLDNEFLQTFISKKQFKNDHPSTYEIAQAVSHNAFINTIKYRKTFNEIIHELKKIDIFSTLLDENFNIAPFFEPLSKWQKSQDTAIPVLIEQFKTKHNFKYEEATPLHVFFKNLTTEQFKKIKALEIIPIPRGAENLDISLTLQTLASWLEKQPPQLKKMITLYLEHAQHEGIFYNERTPLYAFLTDLSKKLHGHQSFGDCATLNVMRVPYLLDEIIRAVIHNPKNLDSICKKYQQYLVENFNDKNAKAAFERLAAERHIPKNSGRYLDPECRLVPQYNPKEIEESIEQIRSKIKGLQPQSTFNSTYG